jgi:hypothetical protein
MGLEPDLVTGTGVVACRADGQLCRIYIPIPS